jgi:hypothetical protein
MIAKYKFKQFNFGNFSGFVNDLIVKYGMGDIVFHSPKDMLVVDPQKNHLGDVNNKNTFLYVWSNNLGKMRVVTFELFKRDGKLPIIEMTFNLDKKTISLNKVRGIATEKVEESLRDFFEIEKINGDINVWWKYTHPVWWIWFVVVFISKNGIWALVKLAWKHKWISGLILLIIIPIIVGLSINYLTYRFGWNNPISVNAR